MARGIIFLLLPKYVNSFHRICSQTNQHLESISLQLLTDPMEGIQILVRAEKGVPFIPGVAELGLKGVQLHT